MKLSFFFALVALTPSIALAHGTHTVPVDGHSHSVLDMLAANLIWAVPAILVLAFLAFARRDG